MTAARKILLALFCTTVSVALAAQEAKGDTSKSEEKPKEEQRNPAPFGQIPMITFPGQQWGQNPWTFGGQPGGNEKKDDGKQDEKNDNPWQNSPWGQPGGGFGGAPGGFGGGPNSGNPWEQDFGGFGGFGVAVWRVSGDVWVPKDLYLLSLGVWRRGNRACRRSGGAIRREAAEGRTQRYADTRCGLCPTSVNRSRGRRAGRGRPRVAG